MMKEVVDRVRRMSLEKINSEKGRMRMWKRLMVANILTSTIAMLNVSTKRPLSDPDSAQDSKKDMQMWNRFRVMLSNRLTFQSVITVNVQTWC